MPEMDKGGWGGSALVARMSHRVLASDTDVSEERLE